MRYLIIFFTLFLTFSLFSKEIYILKFKKYDQSIIKNYKDSYKIVKFFSISNEKLLQLKERGEFLSKNTLPDLRNYFFIINPDQNIIDKFKKDKNIITFYKQNKPIKPPVDIDPLTNLYYENQGYLFTKNETGGVEATYGWEYQGGDGSGVTVVDLEYDWILDHEDLELDETATIYSSETGDNLTGTPIISIDYPEYQAEHHGTSVLGEIGAIDNEYGVTGIANGADIKVVSSYTSEYGFSVADAIVRVIPELEAGSVILLEAQTVRLGGGSGEYIPVEYDQAEFDAIKTATSNHIIVVEAGGNGNQNLDGEIFNICSGDNLNSGDQPCFNIETRDSGAIIVGAGVPVTNQREYFSTYGSRVDVQAWGSAIYSTGYGDLFLPNGDPKQSYTSNFGGTSGASPIITAIVAQVQGRYKVLNPGEYLTPFQMREILKNSQHSFSQTGDISKNIGPMPSTGLIFRNYFGETTLCGDQRCEIYEICAEGICMLDQGRCETDNDCPLNKGCSDQNYCVDQCGAGGYCNHWESCVGEMCEPLEGRCNSDDDCEQFNICDSENFCHDLCSDVDCQENAHCEYIDNNTYCICDWGYVEDIYNGTCSLGTCYDFNHICDNQRTNMHCEIVDQLPKCVCDEGSIYKDETRCISPCDEIDCSGNGVCEIENNVPKCVCEEGYIADNLTCIENLCYQESCSDKGVCEIVDNQAQCICEDGYISDGLNCIKKDGKNDEGCNISGGTNTINLYLYLMIFGILFFMKKRKKSSI